ncbi:phosphate/phosphite/phosphonate ABC transporter substrate-binding protein [Aphanothece microscopica]
MALPGETREHHRTRNPSLARMGTAGLAVLSLLLGSCSGGDSVSRQPLCGPSGTLRVGLIDPREGLSASTQLPFADQEIEGLRTLLMEASQCEVQLEPLSSTDRARDKLEAHQWDAAFLPPGLTAFALRQAAGYSPLRVLGGRHTSRSSILVLASSRFQSLADLNGARVGLLPRGSLTGFYLPLYNMHGLSLGQVTFALDFPALQTMLNEGQVDAIAWDDSLPPPSVPVRSLASDTHKIPLGALVLSGSLADADYLPFLKNLDASSAQMPATIGYAATMMPNQRELQPLKAIVESVESWDMPLDGQPHRVFGKKVGE